MSVLGPSVRVLTDSDEEVDHEADVKGQVDLLAGVLVVRNAVLHTFPATTNCQTASHFSHRSDQRFTDLASAGAGQGKSHY